MLSQYNGYEYEIDVHVPKEAAPEEGYSVVFVLDGQRYSKMMERVLQSQIRMAMKTGVKPLLIVGIGHQEADVPQQRFYDFTAPAETYHFPKRRGRDMPVMPAGGAEKLMDFLIKQLLPFLATTYTVNEKDVAIYGHSLGGLFVLWSYVQHPHVFSQYVALSPSVWWNKHELLTLIHETNKTYSAPLFITVGGEEGDMVDDAARFVQIAATKHIPSTFYVAQEENHASIIPTTMSRVLRFLKASSAVHI